MLHSDILFTGFYGHKNTGDDAFVEVCSWGAKKYWQKSNLRFLAKKENLPNTIISVKGYPFSIPKTYRFQKQFLLQNTDYLISGGGSTIYSKMRADNIKNQALQLKRKGSKIKIGGIGVSVGPFKSIEDEKAVVDYLKNIDFLAVRDQFSYDYVSSLDLPYKPINAFDLAALLPEIYNYRKKNKEYKSRKTIGISVCPYESLNSKLDINNEHKRNKLIKELIKKLDKSGDYLFKFYIINGHERIGDMQLTLETIVETSPKNYLISHYCKNTQEVWESIAKCDFVISTRLHAAIFACFAKTPFMLNEYHRKCTDFLNTVGYKDQYRLFDSDYNVNEKVEQISNILSSSDGYIAPDKVEKMENLAKLNFTAITL
jgi:polysaccharide pyruvyl transferase WcaK-like protein